MCGGYDGNFVELMKINTKNNFAFFSFNGNLINKQQKYQKIIIIITVSSFIFHDNRQHLGNFIM